MFTLGPCAALRTEGDTQKPTLGTQPAPLSSASLKIAEPPQPSSVSIQPTGNLYPTLIHFMGMLLTTLASSSPQAGPSFPAPFSTLKQHQLWALGSPAVLRFSDKRCFQSFIGEGEKVCTNTLGALGLTGVGELV